jgi:uncharacterized protein
MLLADFQPHWYEWVIAALVATLLPYRTAFHTMPKIRALPHADVERIRPAIYAQACVLQWLFAGTAFYLVFVHGLSFDEVGLTVTSDRILYGVALLAGMAALLLYMRRKIMRDPHGKLTVREAFDRVTWLLPRTPGQRRGWWVVSAHAGWGEELFYRGTLLLMLATVLPLWAAAVVSTLVFGFAHIYQGVRGIVLTSILGGMFLGLYFISGSLVIPIIAHAMYDIYAGELGYWAMKEERPKANDQLPIANELGGDEEERSDSSEPKE